MTLKELEGVIRTITNRMRADDNTKLVTKYIEHLSWLLFLKVHEAIEEEQRLLDPSYQPIIGGKYRWSRWTNASKEWRAEELIDFINNDLFPHLRNLNSTAAGRLIASLFQGVTTVMKSGYGLKEVIGLVDRIDFHAPQDVHTFSVVYESLLARLGKDASWSGEFYTPRPIVRFMVEVVDPKLGERVYDPAAGSAGFLAEAFEHMRKGERTLEDFELLRNATFYGQESGELPFLLGSMNLILHGVSRPNLVRRNTLEEDIRGIPPAKQFEVILTNPPFGGRENPQIQQNFPAKSAATEVLFLQHVLAYLKLGGRAAVVVPDGILFREYAAFSYVRQRLVDEMNLVGVVRLPLGAFPYAPDTRTNLLFFAKTPPSGSIRYYQVRPPEGKRAFTKTRPVTDGLLAPALTWIRDGIADENSWAVSVDQIRKASYDLDLLPPDVAQRLDPTVVSARIAAFGKAAQTMMDLAAPLTAAATKPELYRLEKVVELRGYVEERGPRVSQEEPMRFIGVSNSGGLVPFKGNVAKDTNRYRRVEPGDFVYNPMRVNVGSIALCRTPAESGYASPEYVVFRLKPDAPFSSEYLLRYLQSSIGLRQIQRNAQGTIRSRLYFENLCEVQLPVPAHPVEWDELLSAIDRLNRLVVNIPQIGTEALAGLVDSLFLWTAIGTQPTGAGGAVKRSASSVGAAAN